MKSTNNNGGSLANSNGRNLETCVQNNIMEYGYDYIQAKKFFSVCKCSKKCLYSKHVWVGNSIYHKRRYCDFILFHPIKYPNYLIIECKWQQTPGSVEEKYPFG